MKARLDWDLIARAPQGVERLRSLLLKLAVEGKLVAGRPEESSADHLLAQLQDARDAHYSTSAQRPTKQIGEAALAPFDLPSHWRWTWLGQLAHPQAGFAFKSSDFNELGDGLPLIRIRDVGQPFSGTYYSGEYRDEFVVRRGDYLISMDGEFRVAEWAHDDALLNQRVTRLQFFESSVNRRFIAMSLQCRLHELQGVKTYTTVDHLSGGQIATAPIGLPPPEEQHRIVAKVDELMALCDRLEARQQDAEAAHARLVQALLESLTQARDADEFQARWQRLAGQLEGVFATDDAIDRLKQAVLQLAVMGRLSRQMRTDVPASHALSVLTHERISKEAGRTRKARAYSSDKGTEPYSIPCGWQWCKLVDVVDVLNGRAYKKEELLAAGTPVLRVGNLFTSNHWYYSDLVLDDDKYCQAGDLIFAWSASFGPFIWSGERVIYHYHIWKLRPHVETAVSKLYLKLFLQERTQAIKAAGHGVSMAHMTKEKMESLPVALPPLAEQHRIVAKVTELLALCDQLKARIAAARAKHAQLAEALVAQAVAG